MQPRPTPPPLLLIHGAAGSHRSFDALRPLLEGLTIDAVDLPGHGSRADEPPVNCLSPYVACVLEQLDESDATVLVGHSMGTLVALLAALERPRAVRGLVLLAGGARLMVTPLVHRLVSERFHELAAFLRKAGFSPSTPGSVADRESALAVDTTSAQAAADFAALEGVDLTERLASLDVPSLVVAGADDRMVPPATTRALALLLAGPDGNRPAPFELLPGAGHMLHQEQPEVVARVIRAFIETLETTTMADRPSGR